MTVGKRARSCRSAMAGSLIVLAVSACYAEDPPAVRDAISVPGDARAVSTLRKGDQVLRHAVFFKFKVESSEAEVKRVVDAFRGLPAAIDVVTDFEWGTNNSPENLNDEFTHCFLLSFHDEAGRARYLPHEAHQAFVAVLRPHLEKVFVCDYWGTQSQQQLKKELKHAVFFKFKDGASSAEVKRVEKAFAGLPAKIGAIRHFEWGRNNSPEKHDDGFTHCFMVSFDSVAGRRVYLPHPDHQDFVELLMPVLDKARVLDFWVHDADQEGP
ncbi:MAG: Dabb family protein [Pirellulales bacterium]|nr:Dabb family protein [Pirellulales bacterium]